MFKTFVINLDKDVERMRFMHEQLSEQGIEYERISAVNGREYTPTLKEYDEKMAAEKAGHALHVGEIGCALSHKKVYENIVREKIPVSLIFEDDVAIPVNFREIIDKQIALQSLYAWEYLLFNYPVVGLTWIKKWSISLWANFKKTRHQGLRAKLSFILISLGKICYMIPLSLFEGVRNIYKKRNPGPVVFYRPIYLAGAYLLTLEGAEKLLSLSNPILYPADRLPNQARVKKSLVLRCYAPLTVHQQNKRFGSSSLNLTGDEI